LLEAPTVVDAISSEVAMQNFEAAGHLSRIGLAEVMIFDRIHVQSLDVNIESLASTAPEHAAVLEFLRDAGVLLELDDSEIEVSHEVENEEPAPRPTRRRGRKRSNPLSEAEIERLTDELLMGAVDETVRDYAVTLQRRNPTTTCVPIVGQYDLWPPRRSAEPARVATVLDVVIRSFPVPESGTPLERVLDFRSDPDTQAKLLSLRRWIHRVAGTTATPQAIAVELADAVQTYEAHMSVKRLKHRKGIVRTVVGTALDVAENLVRLKPKSAFDAIFDISDRKLELKEAELTAPGRELALIAKARQFRK
jgi:hypothetical protein